MRALFIYWKVAPDQATGALAAVRDFQAALSQRHPPLQAGLYQRADPGQGVVTFMETYAQSGGLDATLARAIVQESQAALGACCQGLRHVEQFDQLMA